MTDRGKTESTSRAEEENVLIIVDVQNDFVTGALGSEDAAAVTDAIIERAARFEGTVMLTQDTHEEDYLGTQEGRRLPVEHCLRGSWGWQLVDGLQKLAESRNWKTYEKPTFGSVELARDLAARHEQRPFASVELIGFCTDICVVSNALLIKAFLPDVPVKVDAALCAGVTPASHAAALSTMASCQIDC